MFNNETNKLCETVGFPCIFRMEGPFYITENNKYRLTNTCRL